MLDLLLRTWIGLAAASLPAAAPPKAIQLDLDTSEAEQALAILDREVSGQSIPAEAWTKLFATAPYVWLKEREASMGHPFTEGEFKAFLGAKETLARREEWRRALAEVKAADMGAVGARAMAWLPPEATIHARVFVLIKPRSNSFVWRRAGEAPAIFIYLQGQSTAKFENTVTHECHHIGLESLEAVQEARLKGLPERVQRAVHWMGAFGEGEAMLAAAGSAERHPHWEDDARARARWDGDLMHFNADVPRIEQLLLEILDGRLADDAAIQKQAAPFWGDAQGAWYTVGYEMAVLVEQRFGRATFDECLLDPRKLLVLYNQIAKEANAGGATLAVWSPQLLEKLQVPPAEPPAGSKR